MNDFEADENNTNKESPFSDSAGTNKFAPDALKLSQSYADQLPTTKSFSNIPVVKPNKQDFIRVHPSSDYRLETMVLELKETREHYLVDPSLWDVLANELTSKLLTLYVNRQDVPKLWPIKLPGADGKLHMKLFKPWKSYRSRNGQNCQWRKFWNWPLAGSTSIAWTTP